MTKTFSRSGSFYAFDAYFFSYDSEQVWRLLFLRLPLCIFKVETPEIVKVQGCRASFGSAAVYIQVIIQSGDCVGLSGFRGIEEEDFAPLARLRVEIQKFRQELGLAFDYLLSTMEDKSI